MALCSSASWRCFCMHLSVSWKNGAVNAINPFPHTDSLQKAAAFTQLLYILFCCKIRQIQHSFILWQTLLMPSFSSYPAYPSLHHICPSSCLPYQLLSNLILLHTRYGSAHIGLYPVRFSQHVRCRISTVHPDASYGNGHTPLHVLHDYAFPDYR